MKPTSPSTLARALAFSAGLAALPLYAATTPWHLTELTGLQHGQAISEEGRVVGTVVQPGQAYRPAYWKDGATVVLNPLSPNNWAQLTAVSGQGQMVGNGLIASGDVNRRGAQWPGAAGTPLSPLPGGVSTEVFGVNSLGTSVGTSHYPIDPDAPTFTQPMAAAWNAAGQPSMLAPLANAVSGDARAVNDAGQIVGNNFVRDPLTGYYQNWAVTWVNGAVVSLERGGWLETRAEDINFSGRAVGEVSLGLATDAFTRAAMWDAEGLHILDTDLGTNSRASRISDAGWVLGQLYGTNGFGPYTDVLWDAQGLRTDLSAVLAELNTAMGNVWESMTTIDLDAQGNIVVNAYDQDTNRLQAFLLSPGAATGGGGGGGSVPEPHSLALVGLGLLGASLVRRKQ